ncbi:MAG: hypothetical protein PHF89_08430, partial [Eubacteriales bacterium]|nr:hypothetical protein [Eubacteriales bacterium]
QVGVAQYGYNYDDFALVSLAALSSASDDIELDEIEKIYAFDVDKSNFAGAIVIVGELDITNYKSGMAVVLSSETVLNDFDDVVSKVCVYQDYKNKNQALELLTHSSLGELSPILPGTVIFPKVNATGLITGYSEIALVQDGQVVPGEGFDYSYSGEYYLGHVAGKYGSRVTLDGLHDVVVPSSANVYVYDELMQSVTVEDMSCFDVIDGRIYRSGEVESASMLVLEYDGEITDVVLYFFGGTGGTVPSETEINFCVAQELAAASVTYFNNADSTITPMLIVAHYENGKLIKLSQTQKKIPAESFEVLSCALLSDFKRGDMVKAILVKSIDSLQPIKTSVYDLVDNDFSDESSITIDYDAIESTTFSTVSYCDDNSELKTINLASNCKVYRNGVATYDFNPSMFLDFYGTVTFADADGENRYSTVSITEYENTVVDYVNTLAKVVLAKEGMPVFYGETSSDKLALLFDTLGNRLDWSLLKENDVLSTKVVQGDNLTVYISTLVQETVEGQITEVDGNIVIINNCAYKVYDGIQLLPGNEGIFYLDILGRIVDFSLVEQANTTYAYVVALAPPYEGSLEGTAQIMFYTSQGEFATYDTATKFTVVGEDGSSVLIDAKDIIGKIEAGMVVTFTLNSQGRINRIILPKADLGATTGFRLYAEGTNATYNYRSESFVIRDGGSSKRVYVDSNTVIMKVGNVEYGYFDDDFELISLEGVSDDIELGGIEKIYAFDVNKSNIAKVIVIVGDFDIVSNPDIAMLVKTYVTSATNGERRAVATVFQNAIKNGLETVDLIASSDIGDYLGLQEGDLFTARLNTAGEIKSGGITKVATINWGRAELLETGYGKASYSMHDVVSRSGAKIETEYGDVIVIPTKANIYVYNSVGSSPTRRVLAPEERHNVFYSFGYNLYDNNDNILDNVQMFVREYDGEITDVVFYLWY